MIQGNSVATFDVQQQQAKFVKGNNKFLKERSKNKVYYVEDNNFASFLELGST